MPLVHYPRFYSRADMDLPWPPWHYLIITWVPSDSLINIDGKLQREVTRRPLSKASLVVQWLRICLPVQGTQIRSLVQEDPICFGATKPTCHNY